MIQCVFGSEVNFLDEWEVSFKSVLHNAPLDSDLHIHIICNNNGARGVERRIRNANLPGSLWRNRVSVTVTNLKSKEENLRLFLRRMILNEKNVTGLESEWMDKRLGLGAFLRLFAYKYMLEYAPNEFEQKRDLRMAFYLDTDVVIISNLNHLVSTGDEWLVDIERQGGRPPLWLWGQGSSGFMGINVLHFEGFWDAVARCDPVRQDPWPKKNDQWVLGHVAKCFTNLTSALPDPSPWSVHIGSGYRAIPHRLDRPAGMLHLQNPDARNWFEGGSEVKALYRAVPRCIDKPTRGEGDGTCIDRYYVDKFCHRARPCISRGNKDENLKAVRNTWGIADYYVRLSWNWTMYQAGESRIPPSGRGHNFTLVVRDAIGNF